MVFSLFQYERLLLFRSDATTLRLVGESAPSITQDTWAAHALGTDAYSVDYKAAITGCLNLHVDFPSLSTLRVVDSANFVPNLTGLYIDNCTNLTDISFNAFPHLTTISMSGTYLRDGIFSQIAPSRTLALVDVSNTKYITHVPSAATVNIAHSAVTTIDAYATAPIRVVANDARVTSITLTSSTTALVWSYAGKTLTVNGATSALTILTPQPSDVSAGAAIVVPLTYYPA